MLECTSVNAENYSTYNYDDMNAIQKLAWTISSVISVGYKPILFFFSHSIFCS